MSSSWTGAAASSKACSSDADRPVDFTDADFFSCSARRSAICSLIESARAETTGDGVGASFTGDVGVLRGLFGDNLDADVFVFKVGAARLGPPPRAGRVLEVVDPVVEEALGVVGVDVVFPLGVAEVVRGLGTREVDIERDYRTRRVSHCNRL